MKEIWKKCLYYPGYEISNLGRVRSYWKMGPKGGFQDRPRILKHVYGSAGYAAVNVRTKSRKPRVIPVHILVLENFAGKCPKGHEAAHLDGNRKNPKLSNLKWVTRSVNHSHKRLHGTDAGGDRNPMATLTQSEAKEIVERYLSENITQQKLADEYGVTQQHVSNLIKGKRRVILNARKAA